MSIIGLSARPETLLFLAWAIRTDLRERLIQVHQARQYDATAPEYVLRGAIKYSQPPVFEGDSVYGPVYEALFVYRLNRVEFRLVDWALRGYNAVYLKEAEAAALDGTYSTAETGILWQSIAKNDRLLFHVKSIGRDWGGNIQQVANALRLLFVFRTPLLMRTSTSSFLFQEFVSMSLEQVNWVELAALVLEIPYQPGETLQKEGDDEAMQLALLKELLWRGYVDFGEFSLHPLFSQQVHDLCMDLTDACFQAQREVERLEESQHLYRN
ncbi:hypothetical protein KSF_106680 [Reticulibacter mediterranei]|uniref:Uncharacterized protein n=1 Tax=Reticulibacter mediterranei TaxID=2778369 RepID=A0A8J3J1K3_9CHLR|nr:hypothetical protein [Reticulibacter mediterranei]GHP00621.1 hypothetical protein KSF_106680 [Reticulibacter mediterranei]